MSTYKPITLLLNGKQSTSDLTGMYKKIWNCNLAPHVQFPPYWGPVARCERILRRLIYRFGLFTYRRDQHGNWEAAGSLMSTYKPITLLPKGKTIKISPRRDVHNYLLNGQAIHQSRGGYRISEWDGNVRRSYIKQQLLPSRMPCLTYWCLGVLWSHTPRQFVCISDNIFCIMNSILLLRYLIHHKQ